MSPRRQFRFWKFAWRWLLRSAYLGLLGLVFAVATWNSFRHFLQGKPIQVPELIGVSLEEAEAAVLQKGLDFRVDEALARHDDAVEFEAIRWQRPAAGNDVRAGATVTVALSLGPKILVVPDLVGRTSRAATLELEKVGLTLGAVTRLEETRRIGVLGQDPPPGTRAGPGQAVAILVAQDPGPPARIMPDFVGQDLDIARRRLEAFGYRVGAVRAETYAGRNNRILRQFPLGGHPAPPGFAVSFVVSKDPVDGRSDDGRLVLPW